MPRRSFLLIALVTACIEDKDPFEDTTESGEEGETTGEDPAPPDPEPEPDTEPLDTAPPDPADTGDPGDSGDPGDTGAAGTPIAPVTCADAAACLYGETEGSAIGFAQGGIGDVNGDGYGDVLIGHTSDSEGEYKAGAVYLVQGPVSGDVSLADADAKIYGVTDQSHVGWTVAPVGDVDGDGYDDVLGQGHRSDLGGDHAGVTFLAYGPIEGDFPLTDADVVLTGEWDDHAVGLGIGGGDLNGDGNPDVAVGALDFSAGGSAYVFFGPLSAGTRGVSSADVAIDGDTAEGSNMAGWPILIAPDLTGDGQDDLVIGDMWDNNSYGAIHVFAGPATGAATMADADVTIRGEHDEAFFGLRAAAGDLDGDGYADLITESYYGPRVDMSASIPAGSAYVFQGPLASGLALGDAAAVIPDAAGEFSLDVLDDRDGDGAAELLVGVSYYGGSEGWIGLFYGPLSGTRERASADVRLGTAAMTHFGMEARSAGDVDGDGVEDVLTGAITYDALERGVVMLFTEGL